MPRRFSNLHRHEHPKRASERRNFSWGRFRHLFWTPTPREYADAPEMPQSRPMADIGLTEQLQVVELYPGYGHDEWFRQNFGEMAREIAGTTLPADYVVEHCVPADDPAVPESARAGQRVGGEPADSNCEATKEADALDVDGDDAMLGRTGPHHPFPAHDAVRAATDDNVAKTRAAQAKRRIGTAQEALTKPVEAEELMRQADVEERNARKLRKPVRKQRRRVGRLQKELDSLPPSRRSAPGEVVELVVVALICAAFDVPVLDISMTDVPGPWDERLLVSVIGSAGIAVFGALIGWAMGRLWERLPAEHRPRVGWSALAALLALLTVTVVSLAVFRAHEMALLSRLDFHIADPLFFGPLQGLLAAAAALASFRYFLADTGRRLLRRLREETAKLDALATLKEHLYANAERLRQAAAQALIDGHKAIIAYVHYPLLEEAEVKSVKSHGRFVSHWFNTVFLRDRFQPQVEEDGFVAFVAARDERAYMLRRLVARALMGLAILSLGIAALALVRHAPGVAAGALAVALALGALGVYVAFLAEKAHDDDTLLTAFFTASGTGEDSARHLVSPNGAVERQQGDDAVKAAAGRTS